MQNQTKENRSYRGKRKAEQKDKSGGKENKTPKRPKDEITDKDIEEMANNIKRLNDQKRALSNNSSTLTLNTPPIVQPLSPQTKAEDWTSVQGQFGWAEIETTTIPYLQRSGEKYVSMIMAENGVLVKFKNVFTNEIYNCFRFDVFRVTPAEALLLNEINVRHCDSFYGKFKFTLNDTLISLADLIEMYAFLNFCHSKLVEKAEVPQNRCGFIKIAGKNCVPYVWHDQKMYLPLFYFEGDCGHLEQRSLALTGWDLAYMKLYCKIQGIRKNLYNEESSRVVEFEMLKRFFPPDTAYQETWPELCTVEGLLQRPVLKVVLSQAKPKPNGEDLPPKPNTIAAQATTTSNTASSSVAVATSKTAPSISAATTSKPAPSIAAATTSNTARSTVVVTTSRSTAPSATAATKPNAAPSAAAVITSTMAPSPAAAATSRTRPSTAATTTTSSVAVPRNNLKDIRPRPKPTCPAYSQPIPPPPKDNVVGIRGVAPPGPILHHQLSRAPNVVNRWRQFPLVGAYPRGSNLLQIPDMGGNNAYYVIKYQLEGRMFHYCINMEPYLTTILLVTLEECGLFMRVPVDAMANAVNVLKIDIFLLNSGQMRELGKYGVYPIRGVVRLTDFVDHLPQLKYMVNGRTN